MKWKRKMAPFDAIQFVDDADRLIEISDMVGTDIRISRAHDPPTLSIDLGDRWLKDIPHGAYILWIDDSVGWIDEGRFEKRFERVANDS